jgi:hypothetical protein
LIEISMSEKTRQKAIRINGKVIWSELPPAYRLGKFLPFGFLPISRLAVVLTKEIARMKHRRQNLLY